MRSNLTLVYKLKRRVLTAVEGALLELLPAGKVEKTHQEFQLLAVFDELFQAFLRVLVFSFVMKALWGMIVFPVYFLRNLSAICQ